LSQSSLVSTKVEVKGPLHSQIELQKTLPRLDQLQFLLLQNPLYLNQEEEEDEEMERERITGEDQGKRLTTVQNQIKETKPKNNNFRPKKVSYTTEELLDIVQASPVQLRHALEALNAFEYKGSLSFPLFLSLLCESNPNFF
jgi:hypothetical protein